MPDEFWTTQEFNTSANNNAPETPGGWDKPVFETPNFREPTGKSLIDWDSVRAGQERPAQLEMQHPEREGFAPPMTQQEVGQPTLQQEPVDLAKAAGDWWGGVSRWRTPEEVAAEYKRTPIKEINFLGQKIRSDTPIIGGLLEAVAEANAPTTEEHFSKPIRDLPVLGGLSRFGEALFNVIQKPYETVGEPAWGLAGAAVQEGFNKAANVFGVGEKKDYFAERMATAQARAGISNEDFARDPLGSLQETGRALSRETPQATQFAGGVVFDPLNVIPGLGEVEKLTELRLATKPLAEFSTMERALTAVNTLGRVHVPKVGADELLDLTELGVKAGNKLNPFEWTAKSKAIDLVDRTINNFMGATAEMPVDDAVRFVDLVKDSARQGKIVDALKDEFPDVAKSLQSWEGQKLVGALAEMDTDALRKAADARAAIKAAIDVGDKVAPKGAPEGLRAAFESLTKSDGALNKAMEAGQVIDVDQVLESAARAQMWADVSKQVGNVAMERFGLSRTDNVAVKLRDSLKAFEANIFLGANPPALVQNWLNNKVMTGVHGLPIAGQVQEAVQMWNKWGYNATPDIVRAATGRKSNIVGMGISSDRKPWNPIMRLWEKLESGQHDANIMHATYFAYKDAMNQTAKGMPKDLRVALSRINPRLPQIVQGAVASGYTKADVIRAFQGRTVALKLDAYIDDFARAQKIAPEAARAMIQQMNIETVLNRALMDSPNAAVFRQKVAVILQAVTDNIADLDKQIAKSTPKRAAGKEGSSKPFDKLMTERAKYWDDLRAKAGERAKAVEAGRVGFNSEAGLKDFGKLAKAETTEQLTETYATLSKSADAWDQKRAGIIAEELKKRGGSPLSTAEPSPLPVPPDQYPVTATSSGGTPSLASTSGEGGGAVLNSEISAPPLRQAEPVQVSVQEMIPLSSNLETPPSNIAATTLGVSVAKPVLGVIESTSGRIIRQPSGDVNEIFRLANEMLPETENLGRSLEDVAGVKYFGTRVKDADGIARKVANGKPAETIGDFLDGRVSVESFGTADDVVDELGKRGIKVHQDDNFLDDPRPGGYRARHLQVEMSNGMTGELQIVPREIAEVQQAGHKSYDIMRDSKTGSAERVAARQSEEALMNDAWNKFERRNGRAPVDVVPDELVDSETGKRVRTVDIGKEVYESPKSKKVDLTPDELRGLGFSDTDIRARSTIGAERLPFVEWFDARKGNVTVREIEQYLKQTDEFISAAPTVLRYSPQEFFPNYRLTEYGAQWATPDYRYVLTKNDNGAFTLVHRTTEIENGFAWVDREVGSFTSIDDANKFVVENAKDKRASFGVTYTFGDGTSVEVPHYADPHLPIRVYTGDGIVLESIAQTPKIGDVPKSGERVYDASTRVKRWDAYQTYRATESEFPNKLLGAGDKSPIPITREQALAKLTDEQLIAREATATADEAAQIVDEIARRDSAVVGTDAPRSVEEAVAQVAPEVTPRYEARNVKGKTWGVWDTQNEKWMTRGFTEKKATESAVAQNEANRAVLAREKAVAAPVEAPQYRATDAGVIEQTNAPAPKFKEGDQVTWIGHNGETLTGTVTSTGNNQLFGGDYADIRVNQIDVVGGIPLGRIEHIGLPRLSALDEVTPPAGFSPDPAMRNYEIARGQLALQEQVGAPVSPKDKQTIERLRANIAKLEKENPNFKPAYETKLTGEKPLPVPEQATTAPAKTFEDEDWFRALGKRIEDVKASGAVPFEQSKKTLETVLRWNQLYHAELGDAGRVLDFTQRAINKMSHEQLVAEAGKLVERARAKNMKWVDGVANQMQESARVVWNKFLDGEYKRFGKQVNEQMFNRVRNADGLIRLLTDDAKGLDLTALRGYTDEAAPIVARAEKEIVQNVQPELQQAGRILAADERAIPADPGASAVEGTGAPGKVEPASAEPRPISGGVQETSGTLLEHGEIQRGQGNESGRVLGATPEQPAGIDVGPVQRLDRTGDAGTYGVGAGEGRIPVSAGERSGTSGIGQSAGRVEPPQVHSAAHDRPNAGNDYRITDADGIANLGSDKTRFKQNVQAIELLKKIESAGRLATPEEQAILVKYVGWGGLKPAFNSWDRKWEKEFNALKSLLTEEEYNAAARSILNAHYTSPDIVKGIWDAVRRLGFNGGTVLEPSMGIGHFFGLMPSDLVSNSKRVGVELDAISARISKQLYQGAQVFESGFERAALPDGYFRLAISNIPFGDILIADTRFKREPFITKRIHNYFFGKSLDKVEDGGLIAFVTSHGTLDATDHTGMRVRQYIADNADLVGAVRLPNTAFKTNAGTEVTTDILFLRKRAPGDTPSDVIKWLEVVKDKKGVPYNEYFHAHPEMMLGTPSMEGSMYGANEFTLKPIKGANIAEQMQAAIERLPEGAIKPREMNVAKMTATQLDTELRGAVAHVKPNTYTLVDGKVMFKEGNELIEAAIPAKQVERVKGLMQIRDDAWRVIEQYRDPEFTFEQTHSARLALNNSYDEFVKKFGAINSPENVRAFKKDADLQLLKALETRAPSAEDAWIKQPLFTERTISPKKSAKIETSKDALLASLNEKGKIDWERMAQLSGRNIADLQTELNGLVFKEPNNGGWVTAETYLSGNVRAKLREAEAAAKLDPAYQVYVDALRKVMPVDVTAGEIDARLGAGWIPETDIRDFVNHIFGIDGGGYRQPTVRYVEPLAMWELNDKGIWWSDQWGTSRYSAKDALDDLLNHKIPTIRDSVEKVVNGETVRTSVANAAETEAARDVQRKIRDEFQKWLWSDVNRAERLVRDYNETFDSWVLAKYDGSHLEFPGMNPAITMNEHQKNAVWRALSSGNTLLAHPVGSGKTYEMSAIAMEARRLGQANKPLIVAANGRSVQFAEEFRHLYPGSNLLVVTKDDFTAANRQKFMARIATGNYDAIIMEHSQFERLPVENETFNRFLRKEISKLHDYLNEMSSGKGKSDRASQRDIQKAILNLESKLRMKAEGGAKDTLITFEQLGVDMLMVDEAHAFKNLYFPTRMQRIKGLPRSESGRAFDMYVKTQWLNELTNGKGVIFATATPLSNTMAEMYTMQRYLQPKTLEQLGISHFDAWAHNFGEVVQSIETTPEGKGFRVVNRFAKFINAPELSKLFNQFADVLTTEQLVERGIIRIPKMKGGMAEAVTSPTTPELKALVEELAARAEDFRKNPKDYSPAEMLLIVKKGREAALDMRLVDPNAVDVPTSKLNKAAQNVYEIWKDTTNLGDPLRNRATQLVFSDIGTPADKANAKAFDVYNDLKNKLVEKGVPRKEIAFIHDYKGEKGQAKLLNQMRSGEIRVLIGSRAKMGLGMNVQERLVAVHHLDVPWRPDWLEQSNGRILRQGNAHPEVRIFNYITEGSLDTYMWQTVEWKSRVIKQIMRGEITERALEDIGTFEMTAAQFKAIASGNPKMMEKFAVDNELQKLERLNVAYRNKVVDSQRQLATKPQQIEHLTKQVELYDRAAQTFAQNRFAKPDDFKILVEGNVFDKRKDAGEAILDLGERVKKMPLGKEVSIPLGEYQGIELTMYRYAAQPDNPMILGTLPGDKRTLFSRGLSDSPAGMVSGLDHDVKNLEAFSNSAQAQLKRAQAEMEFMQDDVRKPFEFERRVNELRKKQEDLIRELDIDKPDAAPMLSSDDVLGGEMLAPNRSGVHPLIEADLQGTGGSSRTPMGEDLVEESLRRARLQLEADGGKQLFDPLEIEKARYAMLPDFIEFLASKMGTDREIVGGARLDAAARQLLDQWLTQDVFPAMTDARIYAGRMGKVMERKTLLNYNARTNLDEWLSWAMPFAYWPRATATNILSEFANKPALAAQYIRLREALKETENEPGTPERFKGKIKIPLPFLPKWMDDGVFIDPLSDMLPIERFINAPARLGFAKVNDNDIAAQIRAMAARGELTAQQAEDAIRKRDATWNKIKDSLNAQRGGTNPMDIAGLFTSVHFPLDWAHKILNGTPEDISTLLPLSRQVKGGSAILREAFPQLAKWIPAGGFDPEGTLREGLGVPKGDPYELYHIDRALVAMAMDGSVTERQARQALLERKGAIYDVARQRAAVEAGVGTLGSYVGVYSARGLLEGEQQGNKLQAQLNGVVDSEIKRLGFEPTQLSSGEKWDKLRQYKATGDGSAIQKFYDAHPEYSVRGQMYNEQEQRLQDWLSGEFWDKYNGLSSLDKRAYRAQVNDPELAKFLDKATRDYKGVPILALEKWVAVLGGYVPDAAGVTQKLSPEQMKAIAPYARKDPAMARAYDAWTKQYGAIKDVQEQYYALPEKSKARTEFLKAHPELKAYWDWNASFEKQNPKLIALLDKLRGGSSAGSDVATARAQPETKTFVPARSSGAGGKGSSKSGGSFTPRQTTGFAPPRGQATYNNAAMWQSIDPEMQTILSGYFAQSPASRVVYAAQNPKLQAWLRGKTQEQIDALARSYYASNAAKGLRWILPRYNPYEKHARGGTWGGSRY